MKATPGETVAGRYRLTELLGAGAMGEVWRATDELLGRQVALKVLRPGYGNDPTFLARFRAEARAVAPLSSPYIAQIFDYGEEPADELGPRRPFLVLEFVPGEPLSAVLERSRQGIGVQQTLQVLASAAEALQVAHDAGVVHRDIKPANLMLTPSGEIKVTDFGIARVTGAEALTSTGTLLGTAHYLAPEVAGGMRATSASDIYALGAVAYECLTGTQLYPGDDPVRVAMAHVNEPTPLLPPSVPSPVADLVGACLAKDPAARPAPAGRLAEQARALAAGAAESARTAIHASASPAASTVMIATASGADVPGARSEGGRRRRSGPATGGPVSWLTAHPWLALLAAAAAAVLLLATVIAFTGEQEDPTVATSTPTAQTPTPTPTPSPEPVLVAADDYLGDTYEDAEADLRSRGLRVQRRVQTGSEPVGTVVDVDPQGLLPQGFIVTVTVAGSEDIREGGGDGDRDENVDDEEVIGPDGLCPDGRPPKIRGRDRNRECR